MEFKPFEQNLPRSMCVTPTQLPRHPHTAASLGCSTSDSSLSAMHPNRRHVASLYTCDACLSREAIFYIEGPCDDERPQPWLGWSDRRKCEDCNAAPRSQTSKLPACTALCAFSLISPSRARSFDVCRCTMGAREDVRALAARRARCPAAEVGFVRSAESLFCGIGRRPPCPCPYPVRCPCRCGTGSSLEAASTRRRRRRDARTQPQVRAAADVFVESGPPRGLRARARGRGAPRAQRENVD